MENRATNLKTPMPGVNPDAGECVQGFGQNLAIIGLGHPVRSGSPSKPVDITLELETIHRLVSRLSYDDTMRVKIEDALMEARVACALPQPDYEAVGEALNRGLKTARRAEDFEAVSLSLRPHIELAVAWLGHEWQRLLGIVQERVCE